MLEVIDGDLALASCVDSEEECPLEDRCYPKGFMHTFTREVGKLMEKYTLADLVRMGKKDKRRKTKNVPKN